MNKKKKEERELIVTEFLFYVKSCPGTLSS